jgi:hypothetical protein
VKVEKEDLKLLRTLKFNHAWLLEEDFKKLIAMTWTHVQHGKGTTTWQQFVENTAKVKRIVKNWATSLKEKSQALS